MAEDIKDKEQTEEVPGEEAVQAEVPGAEPEPRVSEETAKEEKPAEAAEGEKASEAEPKAPEASEAEPAEGEPEKAGKKRSFFGRSEKAEKALKEAEEKQKRLTEQVQRTMAEFDNFRKRTEKEKAAMFDVGAKSVLEKLLPVVDNFERGLSGLSEEQKAEPFAAGMDAVYKQVTKLLAELDVKPIEALGQPFDPDRHNAVMHVEDESAPENTVVQEFQKGYTYHDSVIRYSMVKVAN